MTLPVTSIGREDAPGAQLMERLVERLDARLSAGLEQLAHADLPVLTASDRSRLVSLILLLHKWNKVYNLTAVRDPEIMVDRHLLDSLVMCRWLPAVSRVKKDVRAGNTSYDGAAGGMHGRSGHVDVMDVGTGAGLPVLPLAIARPDLVFLSVEPNGKKTRFQQQALLELGIGNVAVVQSRIETIEDTAEQVICRAFAAPMEFLALVEARCAQGGTAVIMLGGAERMPSNPGSAWELLELVPVQVPGTEAARHVALCRRRCG